MANFDVELNDEVENFTVEFGEVQRITVDDFDKLRNRPSYAGQTMTHETNIPEVPTAVSQLTNDADYQTGSEVESAISTAVGGEKDAREQADAGLSRDIGVVDGKVDAEADARERADIALQGAIDDEETARKNADNGLQGQIDAITSSSDVVDIVGTYAELLQYPTAGLGDKDVIKVLQDETHNDAMSYYRWNKNSSTWSYIGSEGPYYTKSETNTLLGDKQDALTAGSNITISSNNTISATDTTYTAGNGLTLTGTEFSADTTVLQPKLTAGDGINISAQNVISADIDPADFFTASETVDGTGSEMTLNNTIQAKIKSVQMDGDTYQQTYSGANIYNFRDTAAVSSQGVSVDDDGWITFTSDNTGGSSTLYVNYFSSPLQVVAGTPYNVMLEIKSVNGTSGAKLHLTSYHSVSQFREDSEIVLSEIQPGVTKYILNTALNISSCTIGLRTYLSCSAGDSGTVTFRLSVLKDTSITPEDFVYQPYTGGIPAPSPSYPMSISVVTGAQTVKVTGKNLWGGFINDYSLTDHDVAFVNYKDGSISANGTASSSAYSMYAAAAASEGRTQQFPAGTYTLSGGTNAVRVMFIIVGPGTAYITDATTGKVTFTLSETVSGYIRAYVPSGTRANGTIHPQLELNSTATAYEPYQSQSYTIDLGATELCKIGDYQDYIYKSGDDWYVHKATGMYTLDGTEDWHYYQDNVCYADSLPMPTPANVSVRCYNNYYEGVNNTVSADAFIALVFNLPFAINVHTIQRLVRIKNTNYTQASDLKTWLSTHNTTLYYVIATPTDTQITDATLISELNALADALGYKDKTIITVSATGTNLPAILEVSAYRNSLAGVLGVIGRAEAA